MTGLTLFGIRNCDTMKKARTWLDAAGVGYRFHDYRVDGVSQAELRRWCDRLGWEKLLNRSGTTFRRLPEAQRADLDESRAIELMLAQPAMIRRPVLEGGDVLLAGFRAEDYALALAPAG